jgi:hypothetical protein
MTGKLGALVLGKTPEQICGLLGEPTDVEVLEDCGVAWTTVRYVFTTLPSKAPNRARLVRDKWKYTPRLVFRNGICVRYAELEAKLLADRGGIETQVRPPDPRWKRITNWPCPIRSGTSDTPTPPN